jgi:hypothetical protein
MPAMSLLPEDDLDFSSMNGVVESANAGLTSTSPPSGPPNTSSQIPDGNDPSLTKYPPILVIATQMAAQDGTYQKVVNELSQTSTGKVECQMVDRIIDGATQLVSSQYTLITLILPSQFITSSLLTILEPALAAGGQLQLRSAAGGFSEGEIETMKSELKVVGLIPKVDASSSTAGSEECPVVVSHFSPKQISLVVFFDKGKLK